MASSAGTRLRAERNARRWTQRTLAEELHKAAGTAYPPVSSMIRMIRGWEAGDHHPGAEWRRAYSSALGIPEDVLFRESDSLAGPMPILVASPISIGPTSPPENLTVESVEAFLQELYRLEAENGGDNLCKVVGTHVQAATSLFHQGSLTSTSEERLFQSVAGLTQMAGWLSIDADRNRDATRYLGAALYSAYEIDDLSLAAHVLGYMSLNALYEGKLRKALACAKTGADLALSEQQPHTVAILHQRVARAHARLRETDACKRRLDQAAIAFEDDSADEEVPQWASYVNKLEILAQRGACLLDMDELEPAITVLTQVIETIELQSPALQRDLAHYKIRLGSAYEKSGEPEQAADLARQAHGITQRVGSTRVAKRLSELIETLESYDTPEVRDVIGLVKEN